MSVGEVLELSFSDGATVAAPSLAYLKAGALVSFATDAAYVTAKGSAAAAGDIYYNTTIKGPRIYVASLGWFSIPAYLVTGSIASPSNIVAGTGVAPAGVANETIFIQGSGGPVIVSASPQIAAGVNVGDKLRLYGSSDANTVTLANGTGVIMNGVKVMKLDSIIDFVWNGSSHVEASRNEI